ELDELHHDFVEGETVPPTTSEDGYTVYTCSRCGEIELRDIVPALGINVTVLPSDLGTATINGNNVVTDAVTVNVAEKADVVLTATPVKGAHFVGWNVDGKLVYTEADITVKALANITYEPVFEVAGDEFTVVFTDKYGNVFNTQTVTSGADIVVPDAPVVTGYNFVGWSVDDIAGLTTSATINAKYERIADDTYTVTAPGCTIATPYTTAEDVNSGISYDTLVTVTAPNATAWKVDNATVAYGESYSFYVGADVTVVAVFDDTVTAVPTVAAVTPEGVAIGTPGQIKASFLATRSMTDDCTYVNAGFVYALNPAANTITLADVNDSTVLASYCATDAEQFCLNIGRISQTGTIVARAFLAYVDASGVTQVIYAEPQSFTY
ncbi:MAG: InlB B-repeat-containing protein, partial [Eubacterium sp.]